MHMTRADSRRVRAARDKARQAELREEARQAELREEARQAELREEARQAELREEARQAELREEASRGAWPCRSQQPAPCRRQQLAMPGAAPGGCQKQHRADAGVESWGLVLDGLASASDDVFVCGMSDVGSPVSRGVGSARERVGRRQ
jgi:hypothetical protein